MKNSLSLQVLVMDQGSVGEYKSPKELLTDRSVPAPYTLHPTPYTLHPTFRTLHPTLYTLHPTPYTLHPTPYTLHPTQEGGARDLESPKELLTDRSAPTYRVQCAASCVRVRLVGRALRDCLA